eukprot:3200936-Pyramimonas_sp.AAC.1
MFRVSFAQCVGVASHAHMCNEGHVHALACSLGSRTRAMYDITEHVHCSMAKMSCTTCQLRTLQCLLIISRLARGRAVVRACGGKDRAERLQHGAALRYAFLR